MQLNRKDLLSILDCLADEYPQVFVREQHLPHKPLKLHIDHDLALAYPALTRRERGEVLRLYTSRLMYLQACAEGASRHALDGTVAGQVTAEDAAFAAAKLAETLSARQAKNIARKIELCAQRTIPRADPNPPAASVAVAEPAAASKPWPVLRLKAFRKETA